MDQPAAKRLIGLGLMAVGLLTSTVAAAAGAQICGSIERGHFAAFEEPELSAGDLIEFLAGL